MLMGVLAVVVVASLVQQAEDARAAKKFEQCATLFAKAATDGGIARGSLFIEAARCYVEAKKPDFAKAVLLAGVKGGVVDPEELRRAPELAPLKVLDAARASYTNSSNLELYRIFSEDQNDRVTPNELVMSEHDELHRLRVVEMIEFGMLHSARDFYWAAMVLHHAGEPAKAHELALQSVKLNPHDGEALWLVAASEDRMLTSGGRPQRFGTQRRWRDGKRELFPLDGTVSDAERARWNVRPLEELRR